MPLVSVAHVLALAGLPLLGLFFQQQAGAPANGGAINAAGALAFFNAILGLAQTVGVPAFGVSAAWAGYQLMFSTSPRHQDGAKEQLKWSVIGLVVIVAATQIADMVSQAAGFAAPRAGG